MDLFKQSDFSGGLNAEFDRLKSPVNSYPLLVNGRGRDGVISSVKKHLKETRLPNGIYQTLFIVGDFLIVGISGELYYRNIITNTAWQKLANFAPLDTDVYEIYVQPVPLSANYFNRTGQPTISDVEFNPQIQTTAAALFVTDGLSQGRAVFLDLSSKVLQTYAQWSKNDPEYVPLGIIPTISGNKLFLVSPDRKQILQSVTGRYFDFMINLTVDGDKGGDAKTFAVAVDFNDVTSIIPISEGGLLVSTLYATYPVVPTGEFLFGEQIIRPGQPIPVGAVNHKSWVDIVGDTAFISPTGIQSINTVRQIQVESNNFPFSASIQRYLKNPQSETCAINFDDYALFAVNTKFGRGVFVYDTYRRQFVSFDTGFGTVKKFSLYRKAGVSRLFFINTDNELYEAYGSTEDAVARLQLGDYSLDGKSEFIPGSPKSQHKIEQIYLALTVEDEDVALRLKYYADNQLQDTCEHTVSSNTLLPAAPTIAPFVSAQDTANIKWGPKASVCYKSSLWIEWQGQVKLLGVLFDGAAEQTRQTNAIAANSVTTKPIAFISNLGTGNVVDGGAGVRVENLVVGNKYYVEGTAHIGDAQITDSLFTAKTDSAFVTGLIYNAQAFRNFISVLLAEQPNLLLTGGNNILSSEEGYRRLLAMISPFNLQGAAGGEDWAVDSGKSWFARHERYGVIQTEFVDFFFLSSGLATDDLAVDANGDLLNASIEPDGIDAASNQAIWLRYRLSISTKPFRVVIVPVPLYTDGIHTPGYRIFRWPFRNWGADLVLCGGVAGYERFYVDAFPIINLGLSENGTESFSKQTSVAQFTGASGYLLLDPNRYSLDVTFKTIDNKIRFCRLHLNICGLLGTIGQ